MYIWYFRYVWLLCIRSTIVLNTYITDTRHAINIILSEVHTSTDYPLAITYCRFEQRSSRFKITFIFLFRRVSRIILYCIFKLLLLIIVPAASPIPYIYVCKRVAAAGELNRIHWDRDEREGFTIRSGLGLFHVHILLSQCFLSSCFFQRCVVDRRWSFRKLNRYCLK